MNTQKQITAGPNVPAQPLNQLFVNGDLSYLRSCRFQVQNPVNCELTSYYITRTDKNKFRVKVFRGGKCLMADYISAESFAKIILTTKF